MRPSEWWLSERGTVTSPHPRQETKPTCHEHQLEWINTSPERPPIGFFPHGLGLTPDPLAVAVPMAGGEQNAKLAVGSARLGIGKMGHLVAFLCHLLVRGIELWSPKLGELEGGKAEL